jgi:hypothetical protein
MPYTCAKFGLDSTAWFAEAGRLRKWDVASMCRIDAQQVLEKFATVWTRPITAATARPPCRQEQKVDDRRPRANLGTSLSSHDALFRQAFIQGCDRAELASGSVNSLMGRWSGSALCSPIRLGLCYLCNPRRRQFLHFEQCYKIIPQALALISASLEVIPNWHS